MGHVVAGWYLTSDCDYSSVLAKPRWLKFPSQE
jgi:hypothetical protein